MRVRLGAGARFEPLDGAWAAYSAASGDTLLLNTEAAAVLELLADGAADAAAVCDALASDTGLPPERIAEVLEPVWQQLSAAGLVVLGH